MGLRLSSTVEYFNIKCNLVIVCCSVVRAGTLDLRSPTMIDYSGLLKATHSIKAEELNSTDTKVTYMHRFSTLFLCPISCPAWSALCSLAWLPSNIDYHICKREWKTLQDFWWNHKCYLERLRSTPVDASRLEHDVAVPGGSKLSCFLYVFLLHLFTSMYF